MRIDEIRERRDEIRSLVNGENVEFDVDAIETELDSLDTEEAEILKRCAEEAELRNQIAMQYAGEILKNKENFTMDINSNATMRGIIASITERRGAGSVATMSDVIPESVLNEYVLENAPGAFLEGASTTYINHSGDLRIPIATLQSVAQHTENEELATNGFVPSSLVIQHNEYAYNTGYSQRGTVLSVASMTDLVNNTLMRSMMMKMDGICLDAVAGLEYTDNTNAVKVTAAPTFEELTKVAGMLGPDYVSGAKWYVSSATYFNWLLSLKDSNGELVLNPSKPVDRQAPLGFHICIDSQVPANTIYFGNAKRVHLNYAGSPEVNFWTDFDHNTEKAGVRCVAGAAAEPGSFVKLYMA